MIPAMDDAYADAYMSGENLPPIGAIMPDGMGGYLRFDGEGWIATELPAAQDPRFQGDWSVTEDMPAPPVPYGEDTRSYADPGPAPVPTLGTLGGLGGAGTLTAPFTQAPPTLASGTPWFRDAPGLNLPQFKAPDPFRATTAEDVYADPGYAFLLGEGQKGVQQSAAARGLLNSGGTLKDIARWTEDYAGTRFNDVDQRRRGDYLLNYQTQTLDPYRFAYQSALDAFAPGLTSWTTEMSAKQRAQESDNANLWNSFLFDFDKFRDQRDSTWNKASQVLMA